MIILKDQYQSQSIVLDYGWIWMKLRQSFKLCSILTPDIRQQPETSFASLLNACWDSAMNEYLW